VLIRPENRWPTIRRRYASAGAPARAGASRAAGHRLDGTAGVHPGRPRRAPLIGGDSTVEKEYLVRVEGALSAAGMKLLQHGLELDGVQLKPARVSWQNEHQLRFRAARGPQAPDPAHVRAGRPDGDRPEARAQRGVPLGPLPVGQWRYLRRDEKF